MAPFTERDWKFLSGLRDQLAEEFSRRLNAELVTLLERRDISETQKRDLVREHIRTRDEDFADCFGDWRRSMLPTTALFLRKHGLLTDHHVDGLSSAAAAMILEAYPRKNA